MKKLLMIVAAMLAITATAKPYRAINKPLTEKEVVASTLWMEARGEGKDGIEAVASVIANRAAKSRKPLKAVCLAPYQFSCWNKRQTTIPSNAKGTVWDFCLATADKMVKGKFKTTLDATHYYCHRTCNPSWGKKLKGRKIIGRHTFGRV